MEAALNFIFAYPLSLLFFIFVTISSFIHLWINNEVFNLDYKLMMWFFVPVSLLSLFSILFCFEFRPNQVWAAVAIFIALSIISGTFKSMFSREKVNKKTHHVEEVLGKFTPKYPLDNDGNHPRGFDWHVKMDMLALLGLWVFILLDHKILPWI